MKEWSVVTFKKTCAITFRKHVSEPGKTLPNLSEKLQYLWSQSSIFALEKKGKNLNIKSFLRIRDPLVPTFNETRAPNSRKNVAKEGIEYEIDQRHFRFFGHTNPFFLEKNNLII